MSSILLVGTPNIRNEMLGDAIQMVAASYGLVYPCVPYEWLERAAKETLYWSANNPNPTIAQMNEHQARIQSMCTTGEWNV